MNISELYKKDNYLNKDITHLYNKVIIEYDMKSANTSLCREYKLLPESKILEIENMPKESRVKTIGIMMKHNLDFKEKLKNAFPNMRKRFFEANNIQDDDILSIKKDAIFCLRECEFTEFGKCKFVKKNIYSSYIYINRYELYYGIGEELGIHKIDIKGMNDESIELHKDGMLDFFMHIFKHMETSDYKTLMNYIKRFITKYKLRKLDIQYYREFSNDGKFILLDSDETYDDPIFIPYTNPVNYLNIDYNFINILVPLAQFFI